MIELELFHVLPYVWKHTTPHGCRDHIFYPKTSNTEADKATPPIYKTCKNWRILLCVQLNSLIYDSKLVTTSSNNDAVRFKRYWLFKLNKAIKLNIKFVSLTRCALSSINWYDLFFASNCYPKYVSTIRTVPHIWIYSWIS